MTDSDSNAYQYPIRHLILLAAGLTVVWLLVGIYGPGLVAGENASNGEAGDQFGMVNALFSALALAGVIWTILLQRTEMRQMADHIKGLEDDQETTQRTAIVSSKIQAHTAMLHAYAHFNQHNNITKELRRLEELETELESGG